MGTLVRTIPVSEPISGPSETEGIYYKNYGISDPKDLPDSTLKQNFRQGVNEMALEVIQRETRRVGNSEGLAFLSSHHGLSKKIDEFEKKLATTERKLDTTENKLAATQNNLTTTQNDLAITKNDLATTQNDLATTQNMLKLHSQQLFELRIVEIEKYGSQSDEVVAKLRRRNCWMHGGGILRDIHVVEFALTQHPDRIDTLSEGFKNLYGVSLNDRNYIRNSPAFIMVRLNMRMSVMTLPEPKTSFKIFWRGKKVKWQSDKKEFNDLKKKYLRICDADINNWLSHAKSGSGELSEESMQPSSDTLKEIEDRLKLLSPA